MPWNRSASSSNVSGQHTPGTKVPLMPLEKYFQVHRAKVIRRPNQEMANFWRLVGYSQAGEIGGHGVHGTESMTFQRKVLWTTGRSMLQYFDKVVWGTKYRKSSIGTFSKFQRLVLALGSAQHFKTCRTIVAFLIWRPRAQSWWMHLQEYFI